MNKTRVKILEDMLISKEKIKSEDSSLRVENTAEGLRASISCLESNKLEQATETENLIDNEWEQGALGVTSGVPSENDSVVRTKNFQRVYPNHLYKISRTIATNTMGIRLYDKFHNYYGYQATADLVEGGGMGINEFSTELTIMDSNVAYMKIIDNSNDLNTVYTMTTEAINTDYPSEAEGVTGDVKLKVQNKNNWKAYSKGYISNIDGSVSGETLEQVRISDFIEIPKSETHIFFFGKNLTIDSNNMYANRVGFYDKNKIWIGNNVSGITTNKIIGIPLNAKYVRASFATAVEDKMLAFGTETYYVAHKEKNFTISLGDKVLYKGDKIVYLNKNNPKAVDGAGWYVYNEWNKIVLDGSDDENWSYENNDSWIAGRFTCTNLPSLNATINDTVFSEAYCNFGVSKENYTNFKNGLRIRYINKTNRVDIMTNKFDNVTDFRAYLQENNMILIYKMLIPTYTKIPDEILINQLDKFLYAIREYDDITNFDFDQDVAFEITVEKDNIRIMNKRLDEVENQNTTTQALSLEMEV